MLKFKLANHLFHFYNFITSIHSTISFFAMWLFIERIISTPMKIIEIKWRIYWNNKQYSNNIAINTFFRNSHISPDFNSAFVLSYLI